MFNKAFLVHSNDIYSYDIDIYFQNIKDKEKYKVALNSKKYFYIENGILKEGETYRCVLKHNIINKKNKKIKNDIMSILNRNNGWFYVKDYGLNKNKNKIVIDVFDLNKRDIINELFDIK